MSHYTFMSTTLSELTDRLAPISGETPETLNRQLQIWTEFGALPLIGGINPGRGRARLYEDDALLAAAVAIEVHRWGMNIAGIKIILEWLTRRLRADQASAPKSIKEGKSHAYLVICRGQEGIEAWFAEPEALSEYVKHPSLGEPAASVLVVNLGRLWAGLS